MQLALPIRAPYLFSKCASRNAIFRGSTSLLCKRNSSTTLLTPGPWRTADYLSPTQAETLDATLESHIPFNRHRRTVGEECPPGYHLIYFNAAHPEASLSPDGYDSHQAPDASRYPGRMWAGGSIDINPDTKLLLGWPSRVEESVSKLVSDQKNGRDRVIVTLDRKMKNTQDERHSWAVSESRTLVYFSDTNREEVLQRYLEPPTSPTHKHKLTPSETLLFRYSALTFNSHKIHVSRNYAQESELLPDLVVHGPLMVNLILRWATGLLQGPKITNFSYKNLLPAFVDQELELCAENPQQKDFKVWIQGAKQGLIMSGNITTL